MRLEQFCIKLPRNHQSKTPDISRITIQSSFPLTQNVNAAILGKKSESSRFVRFTYDGRHVAFVEISVDLMTESVNA